MVKKRTSGRVTKKHLARAERERIQRRWILLITGAIALIIAGLLIVGWYEVQYAPVATVNDVDISSSSFRGRVRLADAEAINQYAFQNQLDLISGYLENREVIAKNVLDQMVEDIVVKQEIEKRGLEITDEDVERTISEAFGYFPEGTPTPFPTLTPDPTITALASITPTITEGPSPTPSATMTAGPSPTTTSTAAPIPTPTAYTKEAFLENYQKTLDSLDNLYSITEEDFRNQFVSQLYRQKLFKTFEEEIPKEQEQVQARHILVDDEETALLILRFLEEGRSWEELASEFSTDESNKDRGGDLGWFPKGSMVQEFQDAAFNAEVGEIVGPVETNFGWHIIEILGKEIRPIDDYTYQQSVQDAFNEWLAQAVLEAEVKIRTNWEDKIPPEPDLDEIFASE
jgi:parvulin-like peptidyl-prolyl isomerase